MNIESAKYFKSPNPNKDGKPIENHGIKVMIDGVNNGVPIDPANRHYQAILEWVAEGNTIQEAD